MPPRGDLEFVRRSRAELRRPSVSNAVQHLMGLAQITTLTLVTATRDVEHCGARVFQERLTGRASRSHRRVRPGAAVHLISSVDAASGARAAASRLG